MGKGSPVTAGFCLLATLWAFSLFYVFPFETSVCALRADSLFILEIRKGTSLDAGARGGLADFLGAQRADLLQAAEHRRGHTVRGLLAPGLQDLGYLLWIAGTQIAERVHSRQLDAPRDICKEFFYQSSHKEMLVIQNVPAVLH